MAYKVLFLGGVMNRKVKSFSDNPKHQIAIQTVSFDGDTMSRDEFDESGPDISHGIERYLPRQTDRCRSGKYKIFVLEHYTNKEAGDLYERYEVAEEQKEEAAKRHEDWQKLESERKARLTSEGSDAVS